MASTPGSGNFGDPFRDVASGCPRFWVPRGTEPDLSDRGFLVDLRYRLTRQQPFPSESLAEFPVLGLLGEPGMGKSTVLDQEVRKLRAVTPAGGDTILKVDLVAWGTEESVLREIFESPEFKRWKQSAGRLHLLLDGFDTCLQRLETLTPLLLNRFAPLPHARILLRIACRTGDWPRDLEQGLTELWGADQVGIYELAPLREKDVRAIAEAAGCPPDAFLAEVERLRASQFANRPITLRFLLRSFRAGNKLPSRRVDLFREGCLVLCDENREDLRRSRRARKLSAEQRFAVARRLAAVLVFCQRTAVWTGPREELAPDSDIRLDEILGGKENSGRQAAKVDLQSMRESLATGLFRSFGHHRVGFSHQTYAAFLAAVHLVDHGISPAEISGLILHPNEAGRVVPQLRETAAWLSALEPRVLGTLLSKDPATVFASDTPPSSETDRRAVVTAVLRSFHNEELHDLRIVASAGDQLRYEGIADDLRPYVCDDTKSEVARRAAVHLAQLTRQVELQGDLVQVAIDSEAPPRLRVSAAAALRAIGDESHKKRLKPLVSGSADLDPDDELKGNAIAALWPNHLTADELLENLTPPKRPDFIGAYRQFLSSDFGSLIKPRDRIRALQWAAAKVNRSVGVNALGLAALRLVATAIDWADDPEVSAPLADILVKIADARIPSMLIMTKLNASPNAHVALVPGVVRACADKFTAVAVWNYGVIGQTDLPILISELEKKPEADLEEKLIFLVVRAVIRAPSFEDEMIERVLEYAREHPTLRDALNGALFVELGSEEAERLKSSCDEERSGHESQPEAEPIPDLGDLIPCARRREPDAFLKLCYRLAGTSKDPHENELLPGWDCLETEIQRELHHAAKTYLLEYRIEDSSWMEKQLWRYDALYGYWAFRVLAGAGRDELDCLPDEVWSAWMPSVFGNSYMRETPDMVQTRILKVAYHRSSERFREVLGRLIDSQNSGAQDVLVLDRLKPVWNGEIAALLRSRLTDARLAPRACRAVLSALLEEADAMAPAIAEQIVANAASSTHDVVKATEVALEWLESDPSGAWRVIWPIAETNRHFGEYLLGRLAIDPYSCTTTRIVEGLREVDLAALQICLQEHHPEADGSSVPTQAGFMAGGVRTDGSERGWYWLGLVVMNALIQRGTPAAVSAIRHIDNKAPDANLKRVVEIAQEVVSRKSWRPLSPAELLDFIARHRRQETGKYRDTEVASEVGKIKASPAEDPPPAPAPREFRRMNETWTIRFDGESISLAHKVGLGYIAELLRGPGRRCNCFDLQNGESTKVVTGRRRFKGKSTNRSDFEALKQAEENEGLSVSGSHSTPDVMLDSISRRQFQERLASIDDELRDAKENNDTGRLTELAEEKAAIGHELKAATGLRGRKRVFTNDKERARKAVTEAIKEAIKAIQTYHPRLAEHLGKHISLGFECVYGGDGVTWQE